MYRLASTNSFFNGQRFDGLAEAVAKAKRVGAYPKAQVDVLRDIDGKSVQVVWTRDIGHHPIKLLK